MSNAENNVEEPFWQHHSPHGEFLVSSSLSVGAHGIALLGLLLMPMLMSLLLLLFPWLDGRLSEAAPPPKMALLEIKGESGGGDALGDTLEKLGKGNQPVRTEAGIGDAPPSGLKTPSGLPAPGPTTSLAEVKPGIKLIDSSPAADAIYDEGIEPLQQLSVVSAEAAKDLAKALQRDIRPVEPGSKKGSSKVSGGGSIGGPGKGIGDGKGPGTGKSPTGSVLTKKQKHEMRWQILVSPDGTIHLAKLAALNITLVLPTRTPGSYMVYDLTKSPPVAKQADLAAQREKVMWINTDPREVAGLASVLGLKEMPKFAAIFLTTNLEDRMADLEGEYNAQRRQREGDVEKTYWDVLQRDGVYDNEPTIVHQKLRR